MNHYGYAATVDDSADSDEYDANWSGGLVSVCLLISPMKGGCRIVNKYGTIFRLKHLFCFL